jgi:AcrR family transcriptional regulator
MNGNIGRPVTLQIVKDWLGDERDPEVHGRRERKKAATRRALHRAAIRLVQERGLSAVTVEDITEAADVSARTFFNYFGCKEDAIVGPGNHLGERVAEALAERPVAEPVLHALAEALAVVVQEILDDPERRADWAVRMALVRRYPAQLLPRQLAAFAEFERSVVSAVALRSGTDPDADLYPVVVGAVAVAVVRAAFSRWRQGDPGNSLVDLIRQAFALAASGFPSPARPARASGLRADPDDAHLDSDRLTTPTEILS